MNYSCRWIGAALLWVRHRRKNKKRPQSYTWAWGAGRRPFTRAKLSMAASTKSHNPSSCKQAQENRRNQGYREGARQRKHKMIFWYYCEETVDLFLFLQELGLRKMKRKKSRLLWAGAKSRQQTGSSSSINLSTSNIVRLPRPWTKAKQIGKRRKSCLPTQINFTSFKTYTGMIHVLEDKRSKTQ